MELINKIFAWLRCDKCGALTDTQGSWDCEITILCEKCSKNESKNKN